MLFLKKLEQFNINALNFKGFRLENLNNFLQIHFHFQLLNRFKHNVAFCN